MKSIQKSRASKYPYQPCLGVKNDFENLLQRFSSEGTVRYEKFAECWREVNMACYCAGRQTRREAREYVEQCFVIATQFWLPPSSFLVRAGALYLLYGLYYYQLVVPKAKIRITPEQWKSILEFQNEAREQQHLDLDFVFQKMMLDKAFVFVATPDEVFPSHKELHESKVIPENLKDESSVLDEIFTDSAVNQLSLVHEQYQKMKIVLNGEDATEPDTSLNIIHPDLPTGINKTLKVHKERLEKQFYSTKGSTSKELSTEDSTEDDSEDVVPESMSLQKHLKTKAFEQTAGTYRKGKGRVPKHIQEQRTKALQERRLVKLKPKKRKAVSKFRRLKGASSQLYEKYVDEDAPVEYPQVQEVFCMPDMDSIIPKVGTRHESATEDEAILSEDNVRNEEDGHKKKGNKKPVKEKRKRKSTDTQALTSSESEMQEPGTSHSKKRKQQSENSEDGDSFPKGKKTKKSKSENGESEGKLESQEETSEDKSKKVTTLSKPKGRKKQGSKVKKLETIEDDLTKIKEKETEETDVKEQSAQEKLQQLLNQRKKEARLKKTKKK